ncbi:HAD family acid phosphatase [Microlunatus soli]|uniref:HAD superfamily, subfamily IIIB (Acid phosphatase) n=1 Tax=Microlunatus soli TaxID=630515 RepID=A0A1H1XDA9_9ACTN|nr:HAD family acid phosphatase [Microlunatus soli]SDT06666.1 HAD superfamily, subfamily IIIB (Acid phosphatase) [Microlunatus soli]
MAAAAGLLVAGLLLVPVSATAAPQHGQPEEQGVGARLAPRTHFVMRADGSSGLRADGEGIPNIDSVKSTIRSYYGDTGDGIANKTSSPYITELDRLVGSQQRKLAREYRHAVRHGDRPALVFDADDTTLWTYDMEAAAMDFVFDPELQDEWVQAQRFAATPGMVDLVNSAAAMGYQIFGLTGRNDDQKAATVANLRKVGYTAFTEDRFYTKWTGEGDSQQPDYISCAEAKCSTVEYKALTRRHIEAAGYDIVANFGDQWSDLQGGYADRTVKLPNPTYYLPSPNLPGVHQPWLAPRTHFTMRPDGSSGNRPDGEGIPNIDSVKSTIRSYYGDTGNGISDKENSAYITELTKIIDQRGHPVINSCRREARHGGNPAIVLDADDTTLWTYDMEAGAMDFVYDPALQDEWVQAEKFPATPAMTSFVDAADAAGCTIVGLTGRNDDQKSATIGNLTSVGYEGFTASNYYTKWTGEGDSQQPDYISCAEAKCSTIEYKSQTRAHVEDPAGGDYDIVANFGDQYSDLIGGHADRSIKLPNPTYYLP